MSQPNSHTVDIDRGSGITERYLIGKRSIEQQFLLATKPPRARDLIVTAKVNSSGTLQRQKRGWAWGHNNAEVTLGQAKVFDANGKWIPAFMTAEQNGTTIRVPYASLARATYPVTIDPEIGTNDFRVSDVGADNDATPTATIPRVAYNSTDDEYLVIWSGDHDEISGIVTGENEIFGQLIDGATGTEIGSDFRISNQGPAGNADYDTFNFDITYNSTDNQYLLVWQGYDDPITNWEREIHGKILAADGSAVTVNHFRISDAGPDDTSEPTASIPDVTYNSTDNEYLVVWHADDTDFGSIVDNELEIFGQLIDSDGTEIGSDFRITTTDIDGNVAPKAQRAAVTYNSDDNEYYVAFMADDTSFEGIADNQFEIFGQRVGADGTIEGATTRLSTLDAPDDEDYDVLFPEVRYNSINQEYLVTYMAELGSVPNTYEVYIQRISRSNTLVGDRFQISDAGDGSDPTHSADYPTLAFNSTQNEHLIVWSGSHDGASGLADGEYEIYGQLLNQPVCGNSFIDSGEACDDGNVFNTDTCLNTCVAASCGDGHVQDGSEQCDDGNTSNYDGCSATCTLESYADLETANGAVAFDNIEVGDMVPLIAAEPNDVQTEAADDSCDCTWTASPSDRVVITNTASCSTSIGFATTGVGNISSAVDCGGENTGTFNQTFTVKSAAPSTMNWLLAPGCTLIPQP